MSTRDADLSSALRGSVVPLSLKTLKKKGVRRVKVIERERLLKLLEKTVERMLVDRGGTATPETPTERKRVELLLVELEKVTKTKSQLEHEKGLLEAERSRLAADLERIAQEISKHSGTRTRPEDVKLMLDDLVATRTQRDDAARTTEATVARATDAERTRDENAAKVARLEAENAGLVEIRDALRQRASRLEELEAEAARLSEERDRLSQKNVELQRETQKLRADGEEARASCEAARAELATLKAELEKLSPKRPAVEATAATSESAAPAPRRAGPAVPGFGFGGLSAPREAAPRGGFASWTDLKER